MALPSRKDEKTEKGARLELLVALPGVGHMPAPDEDEKEAARVFYVATTRAAQWLAMGVGGDGRFARRLNIFDTRFSSNL